MKIGLFTIASKNYISYVRVLMESVASTNPQYTRYLCLADKDEGCLRAEQEDFQIVRSDQLGIRSFNDMALRYDIMEFNTAVKPHMFRWLFDNTDLDAIIYLDPDIRVFSKLDCIEASLYEGASVVLTPHITLPLEDSLIPNDYHMLQAGVFNLGFIAASRGNEAEFFMDWWGRRLLTQCAADFSKNLFTDQRWCDLAPCFLNDLKILKDPGANVAYWNCAHRTIYRDGNDKWWVDGVPLKFFHFSGLSPDADRQVSNHQNRLTWDNIGEARQLFVEYRRAILEKGWHVSRTWSYAYSEFLQGGKLPSVIRKFYSIHQDTPKDGDLEAIQDGLIRLCNEAAPHEFATCGSTRVTRLMHYIYESRQDLKSEFNLRDSAGVGGFAAWFETAGPREYALPEIVAQQNRILEFSIGERKLVLKKFSLSKTAGRHFLKRLPYGIRIKMECLLKWLRRLPRT
jgi:hypothetical protein